MIRKAIHPDIESIIAIDTVAVIELSRHDFIRRRVKEGNCYVLTIDERIAAYCVLTYEFYDCGMIDMLMVALEGRRSGHGAKLIRHIETECRTEKLFTSTNQSNTPMQSFLAKLDYQPSGVIYNLDDGDPELVYFKQLR